MEGQLPTSVSEAERLLIVKKYLNKMNSSKNKYLLWMYREVVANGEPTTLKDFWKRYLRQGNKLITAVSMKHLFQNHKRVEPSSHNRKPAASNSTPSRKGNQSTRHGSTPKGGNTPQSGAAPTNNSTQPCTWCGHIHQVFGQCYYDRNGHPDRNTSGGPWATSEAHR